MSGPDAQPTCYRHPDRETYIRCSRCERYVCPDCRVDAAVGYQCAECVREGNRDRREWRTQYGGRTTGDSAYVTKVLLALNVGMYLLQTVVSGLTGRLMQVGLYVDELGRPAGIAAGEFYRLVSAGFLHAPNSVFHLLFNMFALWMLGPSLEGALGRSRFIVLYLLALLGGSALSYAVGSPGQSSVGASGAIFGLFAAHLVVARHLGRDSTQLYGVIAINFILGFVLPQIDWQAHLGGFLAGAMAAAVLVYAPRARRALVQGFGLAAVLALIVAVVALRTTQLTALLG